MIAPAPDQLARDELLHRLEVEAAGKRCGRCKGRIMVGWVASESTYRLRCLKCYPEPPVLEHMPHPVTERLAQMVQQGEPGVTDMMDHPSQLVPAVSPQAPMTIQQFDDRQKLIRHVVEQMEEGVHYGVIPGTSGKSLWEPGAEYLRAAFNIQWNYRELERVENFETFDFRYRFISYQLLSNGMEGPGWEGEAWSKERRFWCSRECTKPCPQDHDPKGMEREMMPHNVPDRALKRSFVAMIRNVTGPTGYFKMTEEHGPETAAAAKATASRKEPEDLGQGDLGNCPEHDIEWNVRETRFGIQASHRFGKDWCRMAAVYKHMFGDAWEALGGDREDDTAVNQWLKDNFGGRTWSKLEPKEFLEACAKISPENRRDIEPTENVDIETGEIRDNDYPEDDLQF